MQKFMLYCISKLTLLSLLSKDIFMSQMQKMLGQTLRSSAALWDQSPDVEPSEWSESPAEYYPIMHGFRLTGETWAPGGNSSR